MAEMLSERERDQLAEAIYRQAVTPAVHRLITPNLGAQEIQQIFGSFQDIAHGSLRAAEEYAAVRYNYHLRQEKLRDEHGGSHHIEVQSPVLEKEEKLRGTITPINKPKG